MPYKKPYRKYKRRYKRRRSDLNRRSGSGLTRSYPLAKSHLWKTRYVADDIVLDSVAGIAASYVFRMNGMWKPDVIAAGHQPIGFDQMMSMYNHFCVLGSRIRITATNTDTTTSQKLLLHLKDIGTVSTNISTIIENGMCRWVTLGPAGGGDATKTLTLNMSSKQFFGHDVKSEKDYAGNIAQDPAEQVYAHVTVEPVTAVDPNSIRFTAVIEYIALLTEPKLLAAS